MDPVQAKSGLRDAIRVRLERMSDKDRDAESRSVSRRIIESLPQDPVTVCAYVPLKMEVNIRPALAHMLDKGFPLFLPRFEGGKMVFRQAENLTDLVMGPFNIPEPLPSAHLLNPAQLAIAFVPARAYAMDGKRLGRGNGGYDIWIRAQRSANPATQFWGIAFEAQIVNDIPMQAHDERVNAIITARGRVVCSGDCI
jgi:5-formyltetrahydrofolate cyclo-ligase